MSESDISLDSRFRPGKAGAVALRSNDGGCRRADGLLKANSCSSVFRAREVILRSMTVPGRNGPCEVLADFSIGGRTGDGTLTPPNLSLTVEQVPGSRAA